MSENGLSALVAISDPTLSKICRLNLKVWKYSVDVPGPQVDLAERILSTSHDFYLVEAGFPHRGTEAYDAAIQTYEALVSKGVRYAFATNEVELYHRLIAAQIPCKQFWDLSVREVLNGPVPYSNTPQSPSTEVRKGRVSRLLGGLLGRIARVLPRKERS